MNKIVKIGILTASDRAYKGIYEDLSGKAIIDTLNLYLKTKWEAEYRLVSDEFKDIKNTLLELSKKCSLILTTGGTGPAKRDVTPEATEAVCQKMLPGFGELMRNVSLKYVPTAILSRQSAGIYNNSLIINLPGKPKSIKECLDAVFPAVPYCIDLIDGDYLETNEEVIKAFRPKK
ncbi:molybdopterin adenylyltransferase [Helicobacter sp. MIT 99-5507]|uniref:molybdopterin adenylyltransferase n=1 Tax=Helicobacter sp. MIT 99-5507 TaxID=152489 RepID=UPI000E1EBEA6|nr:molybdopterin adenylyltransferase [Helicobacter sp. MIT 99-5507]RDU57828.1 molybdopterin adenylyltransferase [Helicobacter sp. MIT 99-5507]